MWNYFEVRFLSQGPFCSMEHKITWFLGITMPSGILRSNCEYKHQICTVYSSIKSISYIFIIYHNIHCTIYIHIYLQYSNLNTIHYIICLFFTSKIHSNVRFPNLKKNIPSMFLPVAWSTRCQGTITTSFLRSKPLWFSVSCGFNLRQW